MLVVSTVKRLLVWDGMQINKVERDNAFGLTWDKDSIYFSWNPLHRNFSVIDRFNKQFEFQESILDQEQWNIHQMYFYDGYLYITATGQNRIARLDPKTNEFILQRFDEPQHCNSIFAYKDVLYFHNSNGRRNQDSDVLKFDKDLNYLGRFVIKEPGHIFHNLYIKDDILYGCCHKNDGSRRSNLYVFDMKAGKGDLMEFRKDTENGFLRGVAKSEDYFFIGESQQEAIRSERLMGNSRILVVDNNFKLVDTFELEDTGQIRDVRLMVNDRAHNGIDYE